MKNYIAAIFFIIIAFFTGLSLAFNICALLLDEENFFKSNKSTILIYSIAITIAIIFTCVSYYVVVKIQKIL